MLNSALKNNNRVGMSILPLITQAKHEAALLNTMSQGFMFTNFREGDETIWTVF